jgi:hypothetical protein
MATKLLGNGMQINIPKFSLKQIVLVFSAVLAFAWLAGSQTPVPSPRAIPPVAQVAATMPLPVYVLNEPEFLPEGFVPGSTWKFTTWTIPSMLTFTAKVERVYGAWAYLTVQSESPKPRWYFIPEMPGTWEPQ